MTKEEALKVANEMRQWFKTDREKEALETLIPELKESEDERIRKEIIGYFNSKVATAEETELLHFKRWIAYLENLKPSFKQIHDSVMWDNGLRTGIELAKQKEQEPISFNEPYNPDDYEVVMQGNATSIKRKEHQNKSDAREKALGGHFLTFPQDKDKNLDEIAQDYVDGVKEYNPNPTWDLIQSAVCYGYHLAEQKPDAKDADDLQLLGFIYDLLNEIEWKDNWAMSKDECLRRLNNYRPQKPVSISCGHENDAEWTEEDETNRDFILELLEDQVRFCKKNAEGAYYANQIRTAQNWLKALPLSLKKNNEDVTKLCSNEWSEEDEMRLNHLIKFVEKYGLQYYASTDKVIEWLKSRRPQSKDECGKVEKAMIDGEPIPTENHSVQVPPVNNGTDVTILHKSNDDETCIRNLESIIYYDKKLPNDTRVTLGEFLSNLRRRLWKPTDEQLHAMEAALRFAQCKGVFYGKDIPPLESLFYKLKDIYNNEKA